MKLTKHLHLGDPYGEQILLRNTRQPGLCPCAGLDILQASSNDCDDILLDTRKDCWPRKSNGISFECFTPGPGALPCLSMLLGESWMARSVAAKSTTQMKYNTAGCKRTIATCAPAPSDDHWIHVTCRRRASGPSHRSCHWFCFAFPSDLFRRSRGFERFVPKRCWQDKTGQKLKYTNRPRGMGLHIGLRT